MIQFRGDDDHGGHADRELLLELVRHADRRKVERFDVTLRLENGARLRIQAAQLPRARVIELLTDSEVPID